MKLLLTLIACSMTMHFVLSQPDLSFEDRSPDFFFEEQLGVLPLCVSDFNGDFRDDVLTVPGQEYFQLSLQLEDGRYHHIKLDSLPEGVGSVWAITAADINGDGFNEAIIGFTNGTFVYKNDLVNNRFVLEQLERETFSQNISLADVNNDGIIDAFVCDDIGYNVLYYGNAASNSMDVGFVFDQDTSFVNGGNYGSAFSDVDGDCDLDLYLAKCKQGENDPTSPDRINLLYMNNNGAWLEEGEQRNVATGAQSWTGTFGDLDNDLDVDLLITNHTDSNMLLLNDGNGVFQNIAAQGFRTTDFPLQSILRDIDNNGYLDIFITGTRHAIFLNQGNMEFLEYPMDDFCCGNDMLSAGVGDLNSDGFLDVYGNFGNVYNVPSNLPDRVFFNRGNDNHWVGFDVLDDAPSRNAIGSKVFLYTPSGIQMREINMGDSYGIGNTLRVHFGLGQETAVDSVAVEWASDCSRQVFTDISIDSYQIIGKSCYNAALLPLNENYLQICEGESAELRAPGGVSYTWNTGETTQNITVNTPGAYQVTITDDTGCKTISETVTVVRDAAINTNIVATNGLDLFPCLGDTVELCALNAFDEVNWSTGDQMQCLQVTSSGQYFASISNACSSEQTDTLDIQFVQFPTPFVVSEDYDENTGQLDLTSSQDNTTWYRDANGDEVLGQGVELGLSDVFNDTTVYLQAEGLVSGDTLTGGKLDFEGAGGQNLPGFPGVLTFDVYKPFTLKSVDVRCFEASNPILLIQNRSQETLLLQDVSLNEGLNTIAIDFALEPGNNYSIRFVGEDPKSFRNTGNVEYPYPIGDGHGEVTSGGFTDSEYFYFYNWQIVPFEKFCQSELVAFDFEISNLTDAINTEDLILYPNPASQTVYLNIRSMQSAEIKLFNRLGQLIQTSSYADIGDLISLDVSNLQSGLYYIQFTDLKSGRSLVKSFVRLE